MLQLRYWKFFIFDVYKILESVYWLVSIESTLLTVDGSLCTDSNSAESSWFALICPMKSDKSGFTSTKTRTNYDMKNAKGPVHMK